MRRLIVCADDLGADDRRNAGIFEAVEAGVVTAVSVLANGPALADAVDRLRRVAPVCPSVGVHLNLSEGRPLSAGLHRLTGPDGCFLGKAAARHLLLREGDGELEAEIERELTAQVLTLEEAVGRLEHLDGHQHVHLFPAVRRAAADAAERHRIRWVRVPDEPEPTTPAPGPERLREEAVLFANLGRQARRFYESAGGLRVTDHFRGLYLRGGPIWEALLEAVNTLPVGLTELMTHPGRPSTGGGAFSAFSTPEREEELLALLSPAFREALARGRTKLTGFPRAMP